MSSYSKRPKEEMKQRRRSTGRCCISGRLRGGKGGGHDYLLVVDGMEILGTIQDRA
jgi:hypothetical protein